MKEIQIEARKQPNQPIRDTKGNNIICTMITFSENVTV